MLLPILPFLWSCLLQAGQSRVNCRRCQWLPLACVQRLTVTSWSFLWNRVGWLIRFFFSFTNSFLMLICNMSCFVFDAGMYGSTCAGSPSSPRAKFLEFGQHNRTLGHETHEKLELQWSTAFSFISGSRPTNKNKLHKMQSATFQEVKHIHMYIYLYTCQCIRTWRPLSPVRERFGTSAHLGTHGLNALASLQAQLPANRSMTSMCMMPHDAIWCHNTHWTFSVYLPLSVSLTSVTGFLLLLAAVVTPLICSDVFWIQNAQGYRRKLRQRSKSCQRMPGGWEVRINHRLSKQQVHITENAAVYYSKLSTSKAPRDVLLFEIWNSKHMIHVWRHV